MDNKQNDNFRNILLLSAGVVLIMFVISGYVWIQVPAGDQVCTHWNAAFEMWLTSDLPPAEQNTTDEIMIWVDARDLVPGPPRSIRLHHLTRRVPHEQNTGRTTETSFDPAGL